MGCAFARPWLHAYPEERVLYDAGNREVVQQPEGLRIYPTGRRDEGPFVHISAVERAGLQGLQEGQEVTFELVADRRTGKSSAQNLQAL
jgi:cold shock CspA family protein